jgi:hypothetical protein
MSIQVSTPWHKRTFDRFIEEQLPALLEERLPLVGYAATPTGRYTCRLDITLASRANGDVALVYEGIPTPDEDGQFMLDGDPYVVVPTAAHERLDEAAIRCVGEQLFEYVEARLGQAPADLPWDEELARAWLPLDMWVTEFMAETAQRLDTTNWISAHTHLRRLIVLEHENVVAPGQEKVVCLFESPEGPNMGRVFTIALGAEVRDGRLVVTDERPEARLGISASMLPFLEHNDANRALMGVNMMRQALVPPAPEPALVQTGNEPADVPEFWTGRDLLTAFVAWGADTHADGIVISESCARRLNYPYPAEPGDKLANRHGTKGVISRVLPDDEMPHLPDGTPVELVYSFMGLSVRMNLGQVLEALAGRIARTEGKPQIVPPFHAPDTGELRDRLTKAGLPASGMETLVIGRDGPAMERPTLVGWVYWNRLVHLAQSKVKVTAKDGLQLCGSMECQALQDVGAYENLREALNTRSSRRPDAGTLSARAAAGPVVQADPPTPMFVDLRRRLRIAGIDARVEDGKLVFGFAPPDGSALKLSQPVPHPWLRERQLTEIGSYETTDEYDVRPPWYLATRSLSTADAYGALVEANDRLSRMLSSQSPERLVQDARAQLESRVNEFFSILLTPNHLRFRERQLFSGRSVLAPGADLRIDQLALPDEMAWTLYGPLAAGELGDEKAVKTRGEEASHALDKVMARSWVILNRAPTFSPTALLAFRPTRDPGSAIRIHPLTCRLLDTDFDGDQAAIYLPLTEAAQREAGQLLSVAGHLARDPSLLKALLPPPEALWGLASLGLTDGGLNEIAALAGCEVAAPNGVINEDTLAEAMHLVMGRDGIEAVLSALQRLMDRGFEVVQASGASISPFIGESLSLPADPDGDAVELWDAYKAELDELLLSSTDYTSPDIGPQLLAIKVRARGRVHLRTLLGHWGPYGDIRGNKLVVRRSLVEGFAPEALFAYMAAARKGLAQIWQRWEGLNKEMMDRPSSSFTVLARARRAERPGIVFCRAAANGEVDPLTDIESRLLVGLPVGE